MSKLRLCVDIETNGFIPDVNKIWCLVAVDADNGNVYSFSDYDDELPSLSEGLDFISKADIVFGHNIIGYDLVVLDYVLGFKLPLISFSAVLGPTPLKPWILSVASPVKICIIRNL